VRPDGTALQRLFRGAASDVDWSPDGRRIAFRGEGGIRVLRRGGRRSARILDQRFYLPVWAPDGRGLAVVKEERDLTTRIYIVRPDGTGLHELHPSHVSRSDPKWSILAGSETEPAWSPDGRRIACEEGDGRIVAVEVASGRGHVIATEGYEPAWSPNGKLIAFLSESALWVANADGSGDLHRLVSTEGMPAAAYLAGGNPSWAPDSQRIVFEVLLDRGRYLQRASALSMVDLAGEDLRTVTFGGSAWDDPSWRDGISENTRSDAAEAAAETDG
jgi:Tol biopolymer transport system component